MGEGSENQDGQDGHSGAHGGAASGEGETSSAAPMLKSLYQHRCRHQDIILHPIVLGPSILASSLAPSPLHRPWPHHPCIVLGPSSLASSLAPSSMSNPSPKHPCIILGPTILGTTIRCQNIRDNILTKSAFEPTCVRHPAPCHAGRLSCSQRWCPSPRIRYRRSRGRRTSRQQRCHHAWNFVRCHASIILGPIILIIILASFLAPSSLHHPLPDHSYVILGNIILVSSLAPLILVSSLAPSCLQASLPSAVEPKKSTKRKKQKVEEKPEATVPSSLHHPWPNHPCVILLGSIILTSSLAPSSLHRPWHIIITLILGTIIRASSLAPSLPHP